MKNVWKLLFVTVLFHACKSNQPQQPAEELSEVEFELGEPILYLPDVEPYQASKTKYFNLEHTKLQVSFDWEKRYLNGKANVTLSPNAYPQDSLVLDAKGFDITSIKLQGEDLSYTYDSLQLCIDLNRTISVGEKIDVEIVYVAKPDELKAIKSGYGAIKDDKGLYFINSDGSEEGKPKQIWTQGETEASSCWFPTIDAPNQKMTQELYITVDTSYTVLSNGEHVYTTNNSDGSKTEYWKQEKAHAPYLTMMAVGEFAKVKDTWNGIDVNYYVEKEYEPYAKDIFGNTPEMLSFFSEILDYPYPWDKYSQIIVRDYVSGAMENTTASVFMEQLQMTDRELLDKDYETTIAHELFHHWFGDLVTCESWSNLPLNESFANYSEYLWLEHKYGKDEAEFHRWEELGGYLDESESKREPLIRYHYGHRMEMFDRHSYNKGGLVLHMLRNQLGDEVFFKSLNTYLKRNEYTDVEIHELRLAFEDVSGEDLNWFFNQWFMSPGHPELTVNTEYRNGKTYVTINQIQDVTLHDSTGIRSNAIYRLPTTIALYIGDRQIIKEIVVDSLEKTFVFDLGRRPDAVVLDPQRVLLADIQDDFGLAAYELMIKPSNSWRIRNKAIKGVKEYLADGPSIDKNMSYAIEDKSWVNRKEGFTFLYESEYVNPELKIKAIDAFKNDVKSHVRAEALKYLIVIEPEPSNNMPLYVLGFADSSYSVNAVALEGYLQTEAQDKGDKVAELRDVKSASLFNAVVRYYIQDKDSTQWLWIKDKYEGFGVSDKIEIIDYAAYYVMLAGLSQDQTQQAIDYFVDLGLNSDDKYVRYTAYRALFRLDLLPGVREKRQKVISAEKDSFLSEVYSGWESSLSGQ